MSAIGKWIKIFSEVKLDNDTILTANQIKELQKRNVMLEEENLILKKAISIFTPDFKSLAQDSCFCVYYLCITS